MEVSPEEPRFPAEGDLNDDSPTSSESDDDSSAALGGAAGSKAIDSAVANQNDHILFAKNEEQLLKEYVKEWKSASPAERTEILQSLVTQLRGNCPAKSGEAHVSGVGLEARIIMWFKENTRNGPRPYRWRKRDESNVIAHLFGDRIKENITLAHGVKPGDRDWIGHQSHEIKMMKENMSQEERDMVKQELQRWRTLGVPREKQRQHARRKMAPSLLDFARKMHWDMGVRIVFLATWREEDTKLRWGCFDYNQVIGQGKPSFSREVYPKWPDSELATYFMKYADTYLTDDEKDAAVAASGQAGLAQSSNATKSNARVELETNRWAEPLLPNDVLARDKTVDDLDYRKRVIRAFLLGYWNLASGQRAMRLPWKTIAANPGDFFESSWWVNDVPFGDPSHLKKDHTTRLLEKWVALINSNAQAFHFHHVVRGNKLTAGVASTRLLEVPITVTTLQDPTEPPPSRDTEKSAEGPANTQSSVGQAPKRGSAKGATRRKKPKKPKRILVGNTDNNPTHANTSIPSEGRNGDDEAATHAGGKRKRIQDEIFNNRPSKQIRSSDNSATTENRQPASHRDPPAAATVEEGMRVGSQTQMIGGVSTGPADVGGLATAAASGSSHPGQLQLSQAPLYHPTVPMTAPPSQQDALGHALALLLSQPNGLASLGLLSQLQPHMHHMDHLSRSHDISAGMNRHMFAIDPSLQGPPIPYATAGPNDAVPPGYIASPRPVRHIAEDNVADSALADLRSDHAGVTGVRRSGRVKASTVEPSTASKKTGKPAKKKVH